MKLEIESEKVLEAAKKCPEWKEELKTLFPEAFEDGKSVDMSKFRCNRNTLIRVRTTGNLAYRSLWLSRAYLWEIKTDSHRAICLVPRLDI